MFNRIILYLKNLDWILLIIVVLLLCFGLIEIYGIALGQNNVDFVNFKKQILFVSVGIVLMFLMAFLDYHSLRGLSNYFYLFGILILLFVLFFGHTIRGTRGWFKIGTFSLQPVEFIKIILIGVLAKYFSSISIKVNQAKHLIISFLITAALSILVMLQPDFGSALLLFVIWLILIFSTGINKKFFIVLILIFSLALGSGWLFFFKDYQKQRIMTFINPSIDPMFRGYNVTQAMIAIGSGGAIGRGLGFGSQSQLKFLPESSNDFLFAVISEELGFLGVFLIVVLFGLFFYRLISNLKKINNDFGIYFILGAMGLIFVEMFINIGMNLGIMPVIGISLPFMSYGGSSIVSSLILVGICESIIMRSKINY